MKKKLESELIGIAHRILRLSGRSEIPQLQEEARQLYEKLTILNFSESHFPESQPNIGQIREVLDKAPPAKQVETIAFIPPPKPVIHLDETHDPVHSEQTLETEKKITEDINLSESISASAEINDINTIEFEDKKPEIVIEKINEKISEDLFIPATSVITEENISFSAPVYDKNDIGMGGESMPIIDLVEDENKKPKSLNDQLKKGIHIGLNDRLAFIKHLFNGSSTDYNRVLSQLNTLNSKSGARQFIKNIVKTDYNNWVGKEEYENRFMEIVTSKFEF